MSPQRPTWRELLKQRSLAAAGDSLRRNIGCALRGTPTTQVAAVVSDVLVPALRAYDGEVAQVERDGFLVRVVPDCLPGLVGDSVPEPAESAPTGRRGWVLALIGSVVMGVGAAHVLLAALRALGLR